METAWVLIFMWFTPADGLIYGAYTGDKDGKTYTSYEECIDDGLALYNSELAKGIPENAMNGECFLMVGDE